MIQSACRGGALCEDRRMDRAAMSCFASKKSGDPSSQGSAGTRHTCILFACHGEMQWSRTRRAQQGARLVTRRRRPLFFMRCLCLLLFGFRKYQFSETGSFVNVAERLRETAVFTGGKITSVVVAVDQNCPVFTFGKKQTFAAQF